MTTDQQRTADQQLSSGETTDQQLVAAVSARSPEALGSLYDRYAGKVYAVCLRVTRDPADAEELLMDVFWEFWSDPDRYDPARAGVGAYLAVMARSRALDQARKVSRRARLREEPGAEETIGEILHTSSQIESPADAAEVSEARTLVGDALDQLSETQRQALTMSFFDGLSHQEIADRTGEPLGTVKGRIRQGLLHVRRSLAARYGELT